MMGFVLFGFEEIAKRHNEFSFINCSATFWTNIFIRMLLEVEKESISAQLEVKTYWMLTCWQDILFIML